MTKTSINYVGRLAKNVVIRFMTRNCYLISVYSDRYKEIKNYSDRYKEIKNKIIEKVEKVKKSYERGVITEEEATEVLCKMLLWDLEQLEEN